MATTRIMPLHIGKGRTESRAISAIIDYVANPQKTDHGRLITGYECDSRVADAEFMLAICLPICRCTCRWKITIHQPTRRYTFMAFFNSAVTVLQTLVIALGAGLGIWGAINLLEGYGNDNPGANAHVR